MIQEISSKPKKLYHSTTKIWDEPVIKPFTVTGTFNAVVYASSDLQQAFVYATKTNDLEAYGVFNGVVLAGFKTIGDYAYLKKNHPSGWIHKVDSKTFCLLRNNTEWVSSEDVAFDISESIRVDSIDQVMERKIQIFSNTEKMSPDDWHNARIALQGKDYRAIALSRPEAGLITLKMNKLLMDAGKRHHLNAQSGIEFVDLDQWIADVESTLPQRIEPA